VKASKLERDKAQANSLHNANGLSVALVSGHRAPPSHHVPDPRGSPEPLSRGQRPQSPDHTPGNVTVHILKASPAPSVQGRVGDAGVSSSPSQASHPFRVRQCERSTVFFGWARPMQVETLTKHHVAMFPVAWTDLSAARARPFPAASIISWLLYISTTSA